MSPSIKKTREWLQDALEGHGLATIFRLYMLGLLTLAAPALVVGILFDSNTAFLATPFLVLTLVAVEYAARAPISARQARLGGPRSTT